MGVYRFYVLDESGNIAGPARVTSCEDDDAAMHQARRYLENKAIEVWHVDRRVGLVEPEE
jgi:hypothetical protein